MKLKTLFRLLSLLAAFLAYTSASYSGPFAVYMVVSSISLAILAVVVQNE